MIRHDQAYCDLANDELLVEITQLKHAIRVQEAEVRAINRRKKWDAENLDLALFELERRIEQGDLDLATVDHAERRAS